jgi:hypothetical protein
VAQQLAKPESSTAFDRSRPAANDSRWKITAFGTLGAALFAALLIAPRYWETLPARKESAAASAAPAPAPASESVLKSAPPASPQMAPPAARVVAPPKAESVAPAAASDALQDVVVTGAKRRAYDVPAERDAKPAPVPAPNAAPVPATSDAPDVASNDSQQKSAASAGAPARYAPLEEKAPLARSPTGKTAASNQIIAGAISSAALLQSAAESGDATLATRLLDRGAPVDSRDAQGRSPLMTAVMQGRLQLVRLLLQRGADPNAADNAGKTALQLAKDQNRDDIAEMLRGAGAR